MALISSWSTRWPWQLVLAGVVALCSLSLTGVLLAQPIDVVRSSGWIFLFVVVHASELLVFLDTLRRETIPRRRVAWACVSISVLCGLGNFATWWWAIKTPFFDIGIFIFLILGLALYFPQKMWTIGNTWIIVFDSLVLAFSCIAVIQSLLYLNFGRNPISTVAAFASVWVSFEFVAFLGTLLLLYRYRHPVLIFAVLATLSLTLGDSISVAKRWLPGTYSTSGLTQWPLYFLQAMNMIMFAFYSVKRLPEIETDKLDRYQSNLIEWVYWTGLPVVLFLASIALAFYAHPPDSWVLGITIGAFLVRSLASTVEGFHLFRRVFRYSAQLVDTNTELQRRQQIEADLAAERARTAMARDIHDNLGSHLHGALTMATALARHRSVSPDLQSMLGLLASSVADAHREMRRAISVLRPEPAATPLPLEQALGGPVEEARRYGLPVVLEQRGEARPVPVATADELAQVVREALTNAHKHAQASLVRVTVDYTDPAALVVAIADDGIGMQTPSGPRPAGTGNGMANMRARVEALGGALELPPAERGVTVWIRIPQP
ncbi:MAG TPA: ATP-binding protein [Roseiflexaceae bacterium]|nr:ATP-binding protein [Roseiflexaceae bacterium]